MYFISFLAIINIFLLYDANFNHDKTDLDIIIVLVFLLFLLCIIFLSNKMEGFICAINICIILLIYIFCKIYIDPKMDLKMNMNTYKKVMFCFIFSTVLCLVNKLLFILYICYKNDIKKTKKNDTFIV